MGSRAIAASCVRHAASSARRSSVIRAVPPRVRGGGRPARRDFPAAPAQRRAPARTTPRPNPTTDRISLLHMQRRAHTRTPRSPLTPQPLRTNRDPTTRTRSMHHPHSQSRRTQPRPRRLHRSPPARRRSHRRGSRDAARLALAAGASAQRPWARPVHRGSALSSAPPRRLRQHARVAANRFACSARGALGTAGLCSRPIPQARTTSTSVGIRSEGRQANVTTLVGSFAAAVSLDPAPPLSVRSRLPA
jgi:hypothetical protein